MQAMKKIYVGLDTYEIGAGPGKCCCCGEKPKSGNSLSFRSNGEIYVRWREEERDLCHAEETRIHKGGKKGRT